MIDAASIIFQMYSAEYNTTINKLSWAIISIKCSIKYYVF